MSLNRGDLHTHVEDGGIYELIDPAHLIKAEAGGWIAGVSYKDADPYSPRYGTTYSTTEDRWAKKFRVWQRPNPSSEGGELAGAIRKLLQRVEADEDEAERESAEMVVGSQARAFQHGRSHALRRVKDDIWQALSASPVLPSVGGGDTRG